MLPDTLLTLRKLRKNLRLPREKLDELQKNKLVALIRHAYENVSYYRQLFDSVNIKPADIKRVEDLQRIPVTSKLMLQSCSRGEILAAGLDSRSCVEDVTSGSTGIPLHVYFTKKDYVIRSLIFIRTFMGTGYRLTDRQAIITDTRFVSNRKHWFQKAGIFRKEYIPVQLSLDEQIELLKNCRPDYIHGYPQSIALIAAEMLSRGINSVNPRMVCTGAELVSSRTRETINAAFGVNMIDTYATIESGLVAWECTAYRGYHINCDSVVLEFLNNGSPALPGESGRAVITNLHSYAMPIIRYEVGDICIPSDETCSCGSGFPLMKIVEGRADDMVRTSSGRTVSPNSITNAMEAVEGVRQFRVIQESEEMLVVKIVRGRGFSQSTTERARQLLNELVGGDVHVDVQLVDEIPRDTSGKIRAVISRLKEGGQTVQ